MVLSMCGNSSQLIKENKYQISLTGSSGKAINMVLSSGATNLTHVGQVIIQDHIIY